jgi:hypothetical protein
MTYFGIYTCLTNAGVVCELVLVIQYQSTVTLGKIK